MTCQNMPVTDILAGGTASWTRLHYMIDLEGWEEFAHACSCSTGISFIVVNESELRHES